MFSVMFWVSSKMVHAVIHLSWSYHHGHRTNSTVDCTALSGDRHSLMKWNSRFQRSLLFYYLGVTPGRDYMLFLVFEHNCSETWDAFLSTRQMNHKEMNQNKFLFIYPTPKLIFPLDFQWCVKCISLYSICFVLYVAQNILTSWC